MTLSQNDVYEFQVGLQHVRRVGLRAALLTGNGFSVQAKLPFHAQEINSYALAYALGRRAIQLLTAMPNLSGEDALRYLANFPIPHPIDGRPSSEHALLQDALKLAILSAHPAQQTTVDSVILGRAADFFGLFDTIFTTNYDLLTYWTILTPQLRAGFSDSFRRNSVDPVTGQRALIFDPNAWPNRRKVHYLHGAMHLYEHGAVTQKLERNDVDGSLVTQFQLLAEQGRYPLMVVDGDSERKMSQIINSQYWNTVYSFLTQQAGSVFTYGFDFSWQDMHILDALLSNPQIQQVWVGLYGDPNSSGNTELVFRLTQRQSQLYPFDGGPAVLYYDTGTAPF